MIRVLYRCPREETGSGGLTWVREVLFNWMWAHHQGSPLYGRPPVRPEILAWLGLDWREPEVAPGQAEMEQAVERLLREGRAFFCDCPGPRCQGCGGRGPAVRFQPPPWTVRDPLHGDLVPDPGQPLLRATDGSPGDLLRDVFLDHGFGTTGRLRDLSRVEETAREQTLARALGFPPVAVRHLAPLRGAEHLHLDGLRRQGYLPEALLSYLGELGWRTPGGRQFLTRPELALHFTLEGLQPEPADWDPARLEEIQERFSAELTPAEWVERSLGFWQEEGLLEPPLEKRQRMELEALALLYADRMRHLTDFPRQVAFYVRDPQPDPAEGSRVQACAPRLAGLLPALEGLEEWDSLPLEDLVAGLDGPSLEALEIVVTGRTGTPGLAEVMALVGREAVLRRLRRALAPGRPPLQLPWADPAR